MKYAFLLAMLYALPSHAQEKRDTIFGVALVLDSLEIHVPVYVVNGNFSYISSYTKSYQPVSAVWPSYSVTTYVMLVDNMGAMRPRVMDVRYYRYDNCREIPWRRLFMFKQQ